MRCWVRKTEARKVDPFALVLIPASEHDQEDFEKLSTVVDLRADIVQPRNGGLHRKAFALLKIVWPHTNYPTQEALRAAMTIGAGFVDETVDVATGKVILYPKSWSFTDMDDIEFQELYNRLVDVALKIVPDSRREDWEQAVDQIVRF